MFQEKYEYKYFAPKAPILYKVGLGMGYLELPQGKHITIILFKILLRFVFVACLIRGTPDKHHTLSSCDNTVW